MAREKLTQDRVKEIRDEIKVNELKSVEAKNFAEQATDEGFKNFLTFTADKYNAHAIALRESLTRRLFAHAMRNANSFDSMVDGIVKSLPVKSDK